MSPAARSARRPCWPLQLLLGWLNLALTAPLIYLYVGLPLVLRQHGWSGTAIGVLQLAGLPAMAKFLLATPIERVRIGQASYRNWSILLGLAYAVALLVLALHDLEHTSRATLFVLAIVVNLLGTWADVPVNALAIEVLPESERMRAGTIRSAAISLGAIMGGGIALLIQVRFGWAWSFAALAMPLLAGAALLPAVAAGQQRVALVPPALRAGRRLWSGYFRSPGHRIWSLLLLCYFPFVGAAWIYLKPLLLDHGIPPGQIAALVGVVGGLAGAASSVAGGRLTDAQGPYVTLPRFAALNVSVLGVLWAATMFGASPLVFMLAALMLAVAMGASGGLVFGVMMLRVRPGLAALDYGIQSSLFVLARTLVPFGAGVLLDRCGYAGMLAGLLTGAGFALGLAVYGSSRLRPVGENRGVSP